MGKDGGGGVGRGAAFLDLCPQRLSVSRLYLLAFIFGP